MHLAERVSLQIRHLGWLDRTTWLWDLARPLYNGMVGIVGRGGLARCINGTDQILVLPELRGIAEDYEVDVWRQLTTTLREGDTVVDVGAFMGLYSVASAIRVGKGGRVIAFEPDPVNYSLLAAQVKLNTLSDRVELVPAAVGAENAEVSFSAGKSSQSHVAKDPEASAPVVRCVRLDTYFPDGRIDVIKIDVEGYEEEVLKGAMGILRDVTRRPRALFIEAHPYAWERTGASDRSLLGLLRECNYDVRWLDGQPVDRISSLSEIVARPKDNVPLGYDGPTIG